MVRYQVILAYDGTSFAGFQRQARVRTVQAVFEKALRQLGWQGKSLLAAGRTDSGVHANGQVVAFELDWAHSTDDLQNAINALLPLDVAALRIRAVPPGFHPRYDAIARRYRYYLYCQAIRQPLLDRYSWQVWPEVDFGALQEAAQTLTGRHDFAAFGTPPRLNGSTIRTVLQAVWQVSDPFYVFEITADAFLYHMVRRLVYSQAAVGQGRLDLEQFTRQLHSPGVSQVQGLAPACGLVLEEVAYPE